MFGGASDSEAQPGYWEDLWCYDKPENEWTLVKGSLSPNTMAYRGIPGQSGPLNHPAALNGACSWTDSKGNLWLFGGAATNGLSNELWRFEPDPDCPPAPPLSNPTISHDTSICTGSKLQISASGGSQYHWTPESAVSNPDIPNPWVSPGKRTTYTVYISDYCRNTDSLSVIIDVHECFPTIPNVFTPNGDGKNDSFKVIYDGPLPYHIIIFNRWGVKLFDNDNIAMPWDGYYKGNKATEGTYFYVITIGEEQFNGTVTLLR
jgi:gliding motility-associated-like protein